MEAVFSWVKNIVVFFLILTLIDEILPDSNYRKYIRLAGGMVLILIVFSPVLKLLNMSDSMDYYYQWESLKTAVAGNGLLSEDGFDSEAAGKRKNDWVLSQYEDNLCAQIAALAENEGYMADQVQVTVCEDEASEDFGQVQTIELWISRPENSQDHDAGLEIKPVETVAPVSIGESSAEKENREEPSRETEGSVIASDEILSLKKLLSGNYGVHMNQITIHVRGR